MYELLYEELSDDLKIVALKDVEKYFNECLLEVEQGRRPAKLKELYEESLQNLEQVCRNKFDYEKSGLFSRRFLHLSEFERFNVQNMDEEKMHIHGLPKYPSQDLIEPKIKSHGFLYSIGTKLFIAGLILAIGPMFGFTLRNQQNTSFGDGLIIGFGFVLIGFVLVILDSSRGNRQ